MMLAYVVLFKWMLASVSCVLAGMLVWALLAAALRYWPALLPRRALWLAAQGVTAGAALLALLPHSAQHSLAPTVTLGAAESSAIRVALPALAGEANSGQPTAAGMPAGRVSAAAAGALPAHVDAAETDAAAGDTDLPPFTLVLPALWTLVYAAGLAWTLARQLRARRAWRGLLAASQRLSPLDLQEHGAFNGAQLAAIARHRLAVMETDAAISPMLIGARRPVLLLPRHLRSFGAEQQHMIIAHELHHWRARDPLCMGVSAVLQTVFWFNPALRWMNAKMEWALELICDQRVLAGRPQQQRKQYAAALLLQWKAQTAAMPAGGVAFGGINGATAAARIRQMQQAALPVLSSAVAWGVAVLMAVVLAGGAMLQPALAFNAAPQLNAAPSPARMDSAARTETEPAWRDPLDKMRVTSLFGVRRTVLVTPHKGIDIAASSGTPVHAVAAGTVVSAGKLAENEGRYGNAVILQHGAQRSLYAHLSSTNVRPGAKVEAGQQIGTVGQTGFATGPHLHFEVRQGEELLNPATKLSNLDARTTKRALLARRQQLGY
ncbi:peptidase domain-containing protein [Janthinobacterium sp. HH01]|uniref:M23/M56 family metallopeptidase n=1 Tax=Janthinobacterium sp. HH01 TaxID=1198452 RepID=UPI0002AED13E|nr:M23/M56 family metallopeptidase [Janthinobacterium sp. HH01]ELX13883.1 peptidase domain-containing protein [Janthinobacterium sp. HH01]